MKTRARFRRKESVAARRIAGESFLIPVCGRPADMENVFVLNPVAEFIWERLDGERTLAEIIAEVRESFEVTAGRARADAVEFLGRLLEAGLAEETA
ncbi:MAG: PqqD family protein [Candidatus Aminicenantes bacterium]|nr:PqqD family protein [Candidatus Aminicenantes bacterium]